MDRRVVGQAPAGGFFDRGEMFEVALAEPGRTDNDPGVGFFRFLQGTSRWFVSALGWGEVTQICISGPDEKDKLILRQ